MQTFFKYLLIFSLFLNVFLGWQAYLWYTAWIEQFITTSDVEYMFKLTNHQLTYDEALEVAKSKYQSSYKTFTKEGNIRIIEISGTQLMFDENKYLGSKANLPKNSLSLFGH